MLTAKRRRSSAEKHAEMVADDYARAFRAPRLYCPLRVDRNRLNKHGNLCGQKAEAVHGALGQIIAYRCCVGHLFQRDPE